MKFTPAFRQQVSEQIIPLLDRFEEIETILAGEITETRIWNPPQELPELVNHYLDMLWVVYISKYHLLCQSLIQALNAENFFLYGMIGRSLIEHTAILKYYVSGKMLPLGQTILSQEKITEASIEELIILLDRHLTGKRFDWDSFLEDYFDELEQPQQGSVLKEPQVNVLTCLQKWIKENSAIAGLYELFCDLVHPNLGSTLLISRLVERHNIGVGGSVGQPVGLEIFNRTFEQLIALFQEVRAQLMQLREFKFPESFYRTKIQS